MPRLFCVVCSTERPAHHPAAWDSCPEGLICPECAEATLEAAEKALADATSEAHLQREHENEKPMESWRKVWREGFVPLLPTTGLESLRDALATNDVRLIQGCTTNPPPHWSVQDWPVEAACAVTFVGWQGNNLPTVAECGEFFAKAAFDCDQALGEPAGCRWFLNWFDETPREEAFPALLAEVELALSERDDTLPPFASWLE